MRNNFNEKRVKDNCLPLWWGNTMQEENNAGQPEGLTKTSLRTTKGLDPNTGAPGKEGNNTEECRESTG